MCQFPEPGQGFSVILIGTGTPKDCLPKLKTIQYMGRVGDILPTGLYPVGSVP